MDTNVVAATEAKRHRDARLNRNLRRLKARHRQNPLAVLDGPRITPKRRRTTRKRETVIARPLIVAWRPQPHARAPRPVRRFVRCRSSSSRGDPDPPSSDPGAARPVGGRP